MIHRMHRSLRIQYQAGIRTMMRTSWFGSGATSRLKGSRSHSDIMASTFTLAKRLSQLSRSPKKAEVDDAVLRNALISKDDSAVLVDYVPMVFEPKTEDEPAHYAQGGLKIPADAGNVQVRFELKLPGVDEAATFEIDVAFH